MCFWCFHTFDFQKKSTVVTSQICRFIKTEVINGGHKASECHHLSPALQRLCADTGDPLRVSLTAHQVQNSGSTNAPPISLIFFLKKPSLIHWEFLPLSSLFPWASLSSQKRTIAALSPRSPCKPPRPLRQQVYTTGQPCIHCTTRPQQESPWRCQGLMLRDSSCLFKWQRCNDSRRQPYRQHPPDYFFSDIKRSGYTRGRIKGKSNECCDNYSDTTIKRRRKKCHTF